MTRVRLSHCLLFAVFANLLCVQMAMAIEDACTQDEECRTHDAAGDGFYRIGDYASSLQEFQKAYNRKPVPRLLLNIGRCHYRLGKPAAALAAYAQHEQQDPSPQQQTLEQRTRFIKEAKELQRSQSKPSAMTPALAAKEGPAQSTSSPSTPLSLPIVTSQPAPQSASKKPLYKRWELWTGLAVGIVVIGAVTGGTVYALSTKDSKTFSETEVYY